jgi:uncharacterized protein (DUF1697 family)
MRYAAFLRGINVGKAKRIAMADLKKAVESLGYTNVKTLLNSGNIVFDAKAGKRNHAEDIRKAIAEKLKVDCRVTVLSADALDEIVSGNPLQKVADNFSKFLVAIIADPADRKKLEPMAKERWHPEAFALTERAAYLWCASGILESKLWAAMGKTLKDGVTSRNWATFLKVVAATKS